MIELSHENMVQLNIALQNAAFDVLSDEAWYALSDNKYSYEPYMMVAVDDKVSKWPIWSVTMTDSRVASVLLTKYNGELGNEYLDVVAVLPALSTSAPSGMVSQRIVRLRGPDIDMSATEDFGELYKLFF